MKRATVTIPDDLAAALENYREAQGTPPSFTAVIQAAVRQYLAERGFVSGNVHTLEITPAKKGSGRNDIASNHNTDIAGI
jgi:metal-responsive CopG/Arc/MetJ family transcriptional regulator